MVPNFLLTYGPNITFILGITNIIFLFLVFFTCRCLMGKRLTEFFWKNAWYQKIYSITHCYWWWLFFISVALHAIIAIWTFSIPRF